VSAPPCGVDGGLAKPRTLAQSRIRSMRPRTRDAVAGFWCQIASSTFVTCGVSMAATDKLPMTGEA
jgi:hypothetical protein